MQTRAPFPLDDFSGKDLPALLRAYLQLNQLKQLFRQGWLRRGVPEARCETVAEHVFAMALLAWWTSDLYAPGLDRERVLRMVLVHELGEVYTGDLIPSDGVTVEEKHRRERDSLEQVLSGLPSAAEMTGLWEEFEKGETPEARFVRQLDRLEMAFQAAAYAGAGFGGMEEFFETARAVVHDAAVSDLLASVEKLALDQRG